MFTDAMHALRRALSVLLVMLVGAVIFAVPQRAAALTPADFIEKTYRWAQASERANGVPASVAIAQSILESGWGESTLTKNANNWFGIKCSTPASPHQNGCYAIQTKEYDENGNEYTVTAQFRKYDTPEKSFIDHGEFLKSRPWYANAFNFSNNADRFIFEVHQGGYATDPQYANKIIDLMQRYNLYQYNVASPATGNPQLAIRNPSKADVGATSNVTGLFSPSGAGRSVRTQAKLPSGQWSTSRTVTTGSRGQFTIPLTYGANSPGVHRFRVQAQGPQGWVTSREFTLERTRTVRVTAHSAGAKALGETTYTWGTATNAPNSQVWTEVRIGSRWSRSQTRTTNSQGAFTIPLTYGANDVGTYTWRVGVNSPQGVVYSNQFTLQRAKIPTLTASSAGTKFVGQDTNAWGRVSDAPNAEVWTEVQLGSRWSRSQTRTTGADGNYVIPLTYGSRDVGTQNWRVGVRTVLGTFYSSPFTLTRTAAPVNVTARTAGTKRVGQTTNTWGTAAGAPDSRAWTEVRLSSGWSRSQTTTTDSRGGFVIPLTYGANQVGSYRWRVGVDTPQGVFYSNEFVLQRTR